MGLRVYTAEELGEIDRLASEQYGIDERLLMEHASLGAARVLLTRLRPGLERSAAISIVCGPGNNGGDGLALARHLRIRGFAPVVTLLTPSDKLGDLPGEQLGMARRLGIRVGQDPPALADVVVDALFGTGLARPLEGRAAELVGWINARREDGASVLSLDVPSGLQSDRGEILGVAVRASGTASFVGLKPGLLGSEAAGLLGRVWVCGIGAPEELTDRFGVPHEDAKLTAEGVDLLGAEPDD